MQDPIDRAAARLYRNLKSEGYGPNTPIVHLIDAAWRLIESGDFGITPIEREPTVSETIRLVAKDAGTEAVRVGEVQTA